MPLIRLTAAEATANRKSNPNGSWGDRASANRFEPIAKPAFEVPFRFPKGSRIFTVGSCFARNVEDELERHGFSLPMRDSIVRDIPPDDLNNYGTPSICNEFAWAFGEEPYRPEDHIVELQPDRFADIHLSPAMRPQPYEHVLARRQAITEAYRRSADCPMLIMTLGLVENWFDTKTGYYLNVAPRPVHRKMEPARFELHVLSFDEAYGYLERAIGIVKKHNRHDLRVLLTVSPVPLTATHRTVDVAVANTYSKACLRAVAETLAARHDFVTYFPSYESVVLSDRLRAYREDFVHVTHELVALNVGRMVEAFVETEESLDALSARIADGGAAVAVEAARTIRAGSDLDRAFEFFESHAHLSRESGDFALEHAQFFSDAKVHEAVLDILDKAPAGTPFLQSDLLRSKALIELGRPQEGYEVLDRHSTRTDGPLEKRMRVTTYWYALLDAALATDDRQRIDSALDRFVSVNPVHATRAHLKIADWCERAGDAEAALGHYRTAADFAIDPGDNGHLLLAEFLMRAGRPEESQAALARFQPRGDGAMVRAGRLKKKYGLPA